MMNVLFQDFKKCVSVDLEADKFTINSALPLSVVYEVLLRSMQNGERRPDACKMRMSLSPSPLHNWNASACTLVPIPAPISIFHTWRAKFFSW
jgi:hypothetical protein